METDEFNDKTVIYIRPVEKRIQRDQTQYDPMDIEFSDLDSDEEGDDNNDNDDDDDSDYEPEVEHEYDVNCIIGYRDDAINGPEYLVDWMPYGTRRTYDPTWEPLQNLVNAQTALSNYNHESLNKKSM